MKVNISLLVRIIIMLTIVLCIIVGLSVVALATAVVR